MTPGTQVLAPQRVVPLAYTPGVVVGPNPHGIEVKMPHKGRWLYQVFKINQLLVVDSKYQSPLLD